MLITADMASIFISYAWPWRNRSLTLSIKIFPNLAWTTRRNEATNFISSSHIPEKFLISSSANVFLSFVAWSLCSCNHWKKSCLFFLDKVCHSLWRRPKALEALYGGQFTLLTQSIKTKSSFNFPPPKQQHSFLRN